MGKNPAFQFYPNDWSRDLEEHPLEIEGAWIRICCKLWWSETRGELTRSYDQWGRILRVSVEEATRILTYMDTYRICDICVTDHGNVTVRSRRMFRDDIERLQAAERQRRKRERDSSHAIVTDCSSSSSSSPTTNIENTNALDDKKSSSKGKKISYNFDTHSWENIEQFNIDIWSKAYPAVDIKIQINKMASWLEANPNNRKSNYTRFINGWLSRSQDSAPTTKKESDEFKDMF